MGALNSSDINLLSRYFRLESPPREKQISLAGSALPVHLNPSLPVFFFMSLGFCHSQPIHFFFFYALALIDTINTLMCMVYTSNQFWLFHC